MLEQELKNIWNNSSQTAQISIETNQLIIELSSKVNDMQKNIRIRDIREISASVIGIIIFSYLLYEIPFPVTKIACAFSIAWFVFVIYKFRKSKKQNTTNNLSLSMTDQLAQQEVTMQQQAVLLGSSAYWYSIPPFIINFIFILGLENPIDYNWTNSIAESILPLTVNFKTGTLIALAFFYAFIIWINKRVVTKDINPLLESIKTMQEQIKKQ
jgi:Ca2+/Na+ antiporter